ncbi:putative ferric-chelate reductase 1 isoform X2 [Stylophora pistillata]|uniref:Putative ferric-chelate reductase 1 n=1 Tax=Stylophora pistillata TaxID=50429 RepID=A0A2B4S3J4_STYPI|nr:putative ferric-chelate reductase 1 isoform X2 [Stylophora pistillata]PFX23976.1 putative ferric-chelate reductase 1 [Stylophora pistillata]
MAPHFAIRNEFLILGVFAVFLSNVLLCDGRLPQQRQSVKTSLMFSADGCGETKSCFFKPESCKSTPNKCDYFLTYKPQGSTITFELSSSTKWAAVGFNHKAVMDGTDAIICSLQNGSIKVGHYAIKGYQTPTRTTKNIKGLKIEQQSYDEGTIKCRFSREKQDGIMTTDLNNKLVFVIFAQGPTGPGGSLREHSWKGHSMSPVNLNEIQNLEATVYDLSLIQIHAVLMVIAWVGFATIGMFIARYMKPVWGEKELCGRRLWFQVHRAIMVITVLLTVIGVTLAFIYVGEWSEDAGAHPVIGIIVLSITVLQPIVATLRPPPHGERRWMFNWAHRSFGLIALALSVINIFLGSVLPAFHLESSAVYVMIVYLLVLAAVVMFEIYLAYKQGKSVKEYCVLSKPQDDEVELTTVSASRTEIDVEKVFKLHTIMFGVLILALSIICLAMLILITVHRDAVDD